MRTRSVIALTALFAAALAESAPAQEELLLRHFAEPRHLAYPVLPVPPAVQVYQRLSLNPYGAALSSGASLVWSGYDAPIRLPANGSASGFALGFTIPNDYVPNTTLYVELLWESPATACDFEVTKSFLFRARAGEPRDYGGASSGLYPIDATTPFTLAPDRITMAAPMTAHETARVRFRIVPTPGEFPTLQPGDAVNFAIFRDNRTGSNDTCADVLGIAGISIVYEAT